MTNELFFSAMNDVEDHFLQDFVTQDVKITAPQYQKKKKRVRIISVIAACLCVAILATTIIPNLFKAQENRLTLDASIFSNFFAITDKAPLRGETNDYQTVHPDSMPYEVFPITYTQTLPVYQVNNNFPIPSKKDMEAFLDRNLPAFKDAFGAVVTKVEIIEEDDGPHVRSKVNERKSAVNMNADYNDYGGNIYVGCYPNPSKNEERLLLNGAPVVLHAEDTDEQIKEKLADSIAYINQKFQRKCTQIKIKRSFYDYSGLESISVYLYENESDAFPEGFSDKPLADAYFSLKFDNDNTQDKAVYALESIYWYEELFSAEERYPFVGNSTMLTLEQAEEMLFKGYVFGAVVCELCAQEQALVSFEDYDKVTLEYLIGKNGWVVPFYAFYKDISYLHPSTPMYAKTHVPAVKIENIEEYFDIQTKIHHPELNKNTVKTTKKTSEKPAIITPIHLSIEALQGFFPEVTAATTYTHEKVHKDSLTKESLAFKHSDTLPVYQANSKQSKPSKKDIQAFLGRNLPLVKKTFNTKVTKNSVTEGATGVYVSFEENDADVFVFAEGENNRLTLGCLSAATEQPDYGLLLNGATFALYEDDTDEQIKEKLAKGIAYINKKFKKNCKKIKVQREYYANVGLHSITVYLYEQAADTFPAQFLREPLTDGYFALYFEDTGAGEYVQYSLSRISWHERLTPAENYYVHKSDNTMLTVAQAKELLDNGYAFAGTACTVCAKREYTLSFEKYDKVSLSYVAGENGWVIPFYTFYKQVEEENGEKSYAKALVPAVKIARLEEFFEVCTAKHHPEREPDAFSTSVMRYDGKKSIMRIAIKKEVLNTKYIFKQVIAQYEKEKLVPITLDKEETVTFKPQETVLSVPLPSVALFNERYDELDSFLRLAIKTDLDTEKNAVTVYCKTTKDHSELYSYWVRVNTKDPKTTYYYYFRAG